MPNDKNQLTVNHHPEQGRFEIELEDNVWAVLDYRVEGNTIYFLHTGVPTKYEGRGIGSQLARAGVDYAHQKGYQMVPLCSFMEDYLGRHPEYRA